MDQREKLRGRLEKMALGKANDAVKLAFMGEQALGLIPNMDLACVAKFKRGSNGSVEIEFIDRLDAIKWLAETADGDQREKAREFFTALGSAGEEA